MEEYNLVETPSTSVEEKKNTGKGFDAYFYDMTEMFGEEKKQFEANKLASMCYCEKLNSKEDDDTDDENDKEEKVKFSDTVVVCPTYTSQVCWYRWASCNIYYLRSMTENQRMTGVRKKELWRNWWTKLTSSS